MIENDDPSPFPESKLTVAIIFNSKNGDYGDVLGNSEDAKAEYDSLDTVKAIESAINKGGYKTVLIEADTHFTERLKNQQIDIAFNIAEGIRGRGREAQVPAVLNFCGIPFSGSDETALSVALDKAMCKRLMSTYEIPTPGYRVMDRSDLGSDINLSFPLIIKPNAEGSSKGIPDACLAFDEVQFNEVLRRDLEIYNEPMLVEEFIEGREFTVGILGNGENTHVFSPMEIIFGKNMPSGHTIYSFEVKKDYKKYISYKCPADISKKQEQDMKDYALRAFNALGCHDFSRVDFRMNSNGDISFIEINPLPGLAPGYSDFPMLAEFSGVGYNDLVLSVLHSAIRRLNIGEGSGNL
jgi:D-alanine-D-alanine ligase